MKQLVKMAAWCATLAAASAPSAAGRSETRVPRGARVVATYDIQPDLEIRGITMDEASGAIWLAGGPSQQVIRVNVGDKDVTWTSWEAGRPNAFTWPYGRYVWANSWLTDTLFRVDTTDGAIDYPRFPDDLEHIMHGPLGVQVMDGVLWVAFHDGHPSGSVARLDPETMETLGALPYGPVGGGGPNDLVATPGGVWVSVPGLAEVIRLDPGDGHLVAAIPAGATCSQLSVGAAGVYIASGGDDCGTPGVRRIDPATNRADAALVYDGWSTGVVEAFGSIWVTDWMQDVLLRIDPATRRIIGQTSVHGLGRLAVGFGSLWGITWTGALVRLQPDPL